LVSTLDPEIHQIREILFELGALARHALAGAYDAIMGDRDKCLEIESADRFFDDAERKIDTLVLRCLALRRPVSQDLRFMIVASRIAGCLERIGDEITSIVRQARVMPRIPSEQRADDLREVFRLINQALDEVLRMLVEKHVGDAPALVLRDKSIDNINRKLFSEVVQELESGAVDVVSRVQIMLISSSLERIGDNLKQIAQDIHYMNYAEDIRHSTPDANSPGHAPTCQVV